MPLEIGIHANSAGSLFVVGSARILCTINVYPGKIDIDKQIQQ